MGKKKNGLELYLHIPFCIKKCDYCDFLSGPSIRAGQEAYIYALLREMETVSKNLKKRPVDTVFIGGGTPSVPECDVMEKLLQGLRDYFLFSADAEVTIEANPGTLTPEKLSIYRKYGINRISIGLQSPNNKELAMLGRIHNYAQFLESFQMAREAGFSNINVDLMSALPGQTVDSWKRTLEQVIALQPEHISSYSLILEEGTDFWENEEIEKALPSEQAERIMYHYTKKCLQSAGYERYEISNYAKAGYACRHNQVYWTGGTYLGMGLGAASYWNGMRFSNSSDMGEYITNCKQGMITENRKDVIAVTKKNQMEEYMFLGLRLMAGVSVSEFERRFGVPMEQVYGLVIRSYTEQGLLKTERDRLMLTELGIDVSNSVIADFLLDESLYR